MSKLPAILAFTSIAVAITLAVVRPHKAPYEPDFSFAHRTQRTYQMEGSEMWRDDTYQAPVMDQDRFAELIRSTREKFQTNMMAIGLDPFGGHASGGIDDTKNHQSFLYVNFDSGPRFTYSRRVDGAELAYGWLQIHLFHCRSPEELLPSCQILPKSKLPLRPLLAQQGEVECHRMASLVQ